MSWLYQPLLPAAASGPADATVTLLGACDALASAPIPVPTIPVIGEVATASADALVPSVSVVQGLAERFGDDFNDNSIDTNKWTNNYGTVSETGGRARIACESGYGEFRSGQQPGGYKLVGSHIHVKVPTLPAVGNGSTQTWLEACLDWDGLNGLRIIVEQSPRTMYFGQKVNDVWDWGTGLTYSATDHLWWRIAVAANNDVTFDTSPDGLTWTTRRTITSSALDLNDVRVAFGTGYWGTETAPGNAEFDNFNAIEITCTAAASAAAAAPDSGISISVDAPAAPATASGPAPSLALSVSAPAAAAAAKSAVTGYSEIVLNDAPSLYWRLGESAGTNANDETTNNRDGTYSGTYTLGQSSLLLGDADTSVDFTTGNVGQDYTPYANGRKTSVEGWAVLDSTAAIGALLGNSLYLLSQTFLRSFNSRTLGFYDAGGGPGCTWINAIPATGQTFHWVLVVDEPNNLAYLYIDGVLQGGAGKTVANCYLDSEVDITLGESTSSANWDGKIDEFAAYEYGLTQTQISNHYLAGRGSFGHTLAVSVSPPACEATASGPVPTLTLVSDATVTVTAPPTATASGPVPVPEVAVSSPAASANTGGAELGPGPLLGTNILDDFNRAGENPLAAPWSWPIIPTSADINLVSNAAEADNGNAAMAYGLTLSGSQREVFATLVNPSAGYPFHLYLDWDYNGGAPNGYRMSSDTYTQQIARFTNGSPTVIRTGNLGAPMADGDTIALTNDDGTLQMWVNGVEFAAPVSDSDYTSGKIGIGFYYFTGRIDNFGGGDTAPIGGTPPVVQISSPSVAATATASGPVPTPSVAVESPSAEATASGPTPSLQTSDSEDAPAAEATASGPVPIPSVSVLPPAAEATASGPVPTISTALDATVTVPEAGTATASGPVPIPAVQVEPPAGPATASGPVPIPAIAPTDLDYQEVVLSDSPEFYWRLNDAGPTTADDASTNNIDGTLTVYGPPYTQAWEEPGAPGIPGTSLFLPDADDYEGFASRVEQSQFDLYGHSQITISGWYKGLLDRKQGGNFPHILAEAIRVGTYEGSQPGFVFFVNSLGLPRTLPEGTPEDIRVWLPDSNGDWILPATAVWINAWPSDNQWVHIGLTLDISTHEAELFVNGVSQGVKTCEGVFFSGDYLVLGGRNDSWAGWIDEFAIYDTILSPETIYAHAHQPKLALASATAPGIKVSVESPAGAATASTLDHSIVLTGDITVTVSDAPTATASGPIPVVQVAVNPPTGIATASGLIPVIEIAVSSPAAEATASGPTPSILINATVTVPEAGTATASGPTHTLTTVDSETAPAAEAIASGPTPIVQVSVLPPAGIATASGPVPTPSIAIEPPAGLATASGPPPSLTLISNVTVTVPETASAIASGPTHATTTSDSEAAVAAIATASGPIPTVQISVNSPAGAAIASGPTPTIQGSIGSPAGAATASVSAPTVEVAVNPPAGSATASAPIPVPGVSVLPPAATATASGPTHSIRLDVSIPAEVGIATASGPVPDLSIVESGMVSGPAAEATASGPVAIPSIGLTGVAGISTASGPVPIPAILVLPPAAGAIASAPDPTLSIQSNTWLYPDTATATASGPTPIIEIAVNPPSAEATASGPVPSITIVLDATVTVPEAGTATASGPVPIPDVALSAPVGTATASGPEPIPSVSVLPPAASATASGPVPTVEIVEFITVTVPEAGTATASGSVPVLTTAVNPPAAGAIASAPVPVIGVAVNSSTAEATASGPTPGVSARSDATINAVAAEAMASAEAALLALAVSPPAGEATVSGPLPVPAISIDAPAAEATASGLAPVGTLDVFPEAALAVASGPGPSIPGSPIELFPPSGTAIASIPIHTPTNIVDTDAGSATAFGLAPVPGVHVFPPSGTAWGVSGILLFAPSGAAIASGPKHRFVVNVHGAVSWSGRLDMDLTAFATHVDIYWQGQLSMTATSPIAVPKDFLSPTIGRGKIGGRGGKGSLQPITRGKNSARN